MPVIHYQPFSQFPLKYIIGQYLLIVAVIHFIIWCQCYQRVVTIGWLVSIALTVPRVQTYVPDLRLQMTNRRSLLYNERSSW